MDGRCQGKCVAVGGCAASACWLARVSVAFDPRLLCDSDQWATVDYLAAATIFGLNDPEDACTVS
jgi:hypothetical protein